MALLKGVLPVAMIPSTTPARDAPASHPQEGTHNSALAGRCCGRLVPLCRSRAAAGHRHLCLPPPSTSASAA